MGRDAIATAMLALCVLALWRAAVHALVWLASAALVAVQP